MGRGGLDPSTAGVERLGSTTSCRAALARGKRCLPAVPACLPAVPACLPCWQMTAWCTPRPRIALAVAVALAAASAAGRLRGARGEVGGVSPGEARAARARQVAADARTPPRNVAADAVAREALPEACHATPNLDLGGPALSWGLTFKTETAAECCQACANKPPTRRGYRCMHWTWCPGGDGEWASECFAPDIHNHTKVRACVRACVSACGCQTDRWGVDAQAGAQARRQARGKG